MSCPLCWMNLFVSWCTVHRTVYFTSVVLPIVLKASWGLMSCGIQDALSALNCWNPLDVQFLICLRRWCIGSTRYPPAITSIIFLLKATQRFSIVCVLRPLVPGCCIFNVFFSFPGCWIFDLTSHGLEERMTVPSHQSTKALKYSGLGAAGWTPVPDCPV